MARDVITGVVIQEEVAAESGVPSQIEVKHNWNRVVDSADKIDSLLAEIYSRLLKMQKWSYKGIVKKDELEQAMEWHEAKKECLEFLLQRRPFLDEWFVNGMGI